MFISNDKAVLVVNLIKAKFAPKKDYMTVSKTGYLLLEFMKASRGENNQINIDWTNKKMFALDPRRAMGLSKVSMSTLRNEGLVFRTGGEISEPKTLSIGASSDNKHLRIRFESKGRENEVIDLDGIEEVDVLMMQKLADFGVPLMMGWHVMSQGQLADDDMAGFGAPKDKQGF